MLNICVVKNPEYGYNRELVMEDIAAVTGSTYISADKGLIIENMEIEQMGYAQKVVVGKDSCVIIGGKGTKSDIDLRCDDIRESITDSMTEQEKKFTKNRLARLNNGVAVINVGGVTDTEIKEKKDRVDDALCATMAAIEQGYVAGGGTTYLQAKKNIIAKNESMPLGWTLLLDAIEAPFRQILTNGGVNPDKYINAISEYGIGYDVKNNCKTNLIEDGIIDPTKVVLSALKNAVSLSSILLTTECVISKPINK
jgi:chaperonin GroEL